MLKQHPAHALGATSAGPPCAATICLHTHRNAPAEGVIPKGACLAVSYTEPLHGQRPFGVLHLAMPVLHAMTGRPGMHMWRAEVLGHSWGEDSLLPHEMAQNGLPPRQSILEVADTDDSGEILARGVVTVQSPDACVVVQRRYQLAMVMDWWVQ